MSRKRKSHDHDEEHIDESWLIPYADLLTLLLALFIVLYSMNSVDVKKFEEMSQAFSLALNNGSNVLDLPSVVKRDEELEQDIENDDAKIDSQKEAESDTSLEELIKQEEAELEDLKKKVDDYIDKHGLTTELETQLNVNQLLITISDNALFAPAQATIKPESRELAIAIGQMLQEYPSYNVVVAGHTDNTPINNANFHSNWDLSSIRASRFLEVMLENKKLDPTHFSAKGYGENHPIADNKTVAGKAKNRRVEVSIIHTYVDTAQAQQLQVNK
ncbi:flagellar motor protein MotB [Paenibacillus sp. HB172176]|uniref:flagellar motor protein MotB n=1 Tax=Paenibacillus sp. HB172176 TaxID=2493690 RepID=UPI00143AC485|nr:flagellar motor protein MotB [Paenibacillus sp. HB172176]